MTNKSLYDLKKTNEWIYLIVSVLFIVVALFKQDINYVILAGIGFCFVRLTEITRRQLK